MQQPTNMPHQYIKKDKRDRCQTNVFVTENVPFQLEFDLLDGFAAVVHDVHIDIDAGSADPDLSM